MFIWILWLIAIGLFLGSWGALSLFKKKMGWRVTYFSLFQVSLGIGGVGMIAVYWFCVQKGLLQ